jgi:hypothetical protein
MQLDHNNNNEQPADNKKFQYWAAAQQADLASSLNSKVDDYYRYTAASGLNAKWLAAYQTYYPNSANDSQIMSGGESGEFSLIKIAEAANIVQHLINLTITDRPAWSPRAMNSDVKSMRVCEFVRGLLDFYMREARVEKDVYQAVEYAFVFGEGFVSVRWDSSAGAAYSFDPDSGQPLNTGDLRYQPHESIDVIRDVRLKNFRDRDWVILREFQNRYNLMAKFPEQAEAIHGISADVDPSQHYRTWNDPSYDTDQIPVFRFLHSKTAALPNGRQTLFLSDETVLSDGALPYDHLPISRVTPREKVGHSFGHAPMFDLIPVNDNLNMLYSTIYTSQEAFGVPNILVATGSNIDVESIPNGMKFLNYNSAVPKPEPMQLLNTPPEIFNTLQVLTTAAERISGVNTTTRGNRSNK